MSETPPKKKSVPQAKTVKKKNPLYFLLSRHNVHCSYCNYNLRGNVTGVCTECGKPFDFKTLTSHRREKLAPFLLTLIPLCMVLPQTYTCWQRFLIRGKLYYGTQLFDGSWQRPPMHFFEQAVMFASHVFWFGMPAFIMLLLVFRQRFTRLPISVQWLVGFIAAFLVFLAYRRYQFWYYNFGLNDNFIPPGDFWYLDN